MESILHDFSQLSTVDGIMACLTLAVLEIVLGIDNLVFISILVGKAKPQDQRKVRLAGLTMAMVFRILLLLSVSYLILLEEVHAFSIGDQSFNWKQVILLAGGLFLMVKSIREMHHKLTPHKGEDDEDSTKNVVHQTFLVMVMQIVAIDLVFSVDSILTAVGLTTNIASMIVAVVISMGFMMIFAKAVGDFINRNPTIVMLALAFLVTIAVLLILEGFGQHVDRTYIYFAMGFAFIVELLNLRIIKNLRK